MHTDRMHFKGLFYDVHIGCYEPERSKRQPLSLEFTADVRSISKAHRDDPEHIVLDYAVVTKALQTYFHDNEFRLLETAAEGAAELLLKRFAIESVQIHLTKTPADMPKGSSVTYDCIRTKKDFA